MTVAGKKGKKKSQWCVKNLTVLLFKTKQKL